MVAHEIRQRAHKIFHVRNAFPAPLERSNPFTGSIPKATGKPARSATSSHKAGDDG
jgi:hypothetical protein